MDGGNVTDPAPPEDTLLLGASVRTLAPAAPEPYGAVALRGSRILAVGEAGELSGLLAPGHRVVDCGGGTLLPAFHDGHVHLTQHGLELSQVDLHTAGTLEEGLARVAERAAGTAPGEWV